MVRGGDGDEMRVMVMREDDGDEGVMMVMRAGDTSLNITINNHIFIHT